MASAAASSCPASAGQKLVTSPATSARTVSLTFDDGPSLHTPAVLDALGARGVRGVFFVTGAAVQAHPDIARRIVREGHVIANHTWSHPQAVPGAAVYGRFDALPVAVQIDEITRTTDTIRAVTGVSPCFFRGPGGWHSTALTSEITRDRGLTIAHWTVSGEDAAQAATTTSASTQAIVTRSVSTHEHPIVLLHDGKASPEPEAQVTSNRSNTVAALPQIIDSYASRGYVFTDPAGRPLPTTVIHPPQAAPVRAHVAALYAHLLGRAPDAGGLQSWTELVLRDGGDPTAMTAGITTSTEYRHREINDAYRFAFGRDVDQVGLVGWRTEAERGRVRLEDLPVDLLGSHEFYLRAGGNDEAFVSDLYRKVLGRDVEPSGLQGWVGVVRSQGRRAAVLGVWDSHEATARRVDDLYCDLLGRHAEPAGLAGWTAAAQVEGDDWVRDQLIRSLEYRTRATTRF
ncbi:polysaccharide deacetylase family protein [Aquipuribacter hungaricus]|uniref:Polysaccharide deacetylase family protein n=2 Tax=Aquipuribacter hungaricus TaxID=545624 RepID=A0ABV7WE68_9MICO